MSRLESWMYLSLLLVLIACASRPHTANAILPSAKPLCTDTTTIQTKWDLWSQGTCLRGANIWQKRITPADGGGLGQGPLGPPYDAKSFSQLASHGANVVNISHPGIFTEEPPYALDREAQENLDELLIKLAQANLYAVISFRTGPGRSEIGFSNDDATDTNAHDIWSSSEAQDAWVKMWKAAALRYRTHSIVVGYDLMVEPNANWVLFREDDPDAFMSEHKGELADWNNLAGKLVSTVRSVDSETPILLSSMNYGDAGWLRVLDSNSSFRLVGTFHFYSPYEFTHQNPPLKMKYPGKIPGSEGGETEWIDSLWIENRLRDAARFREARQWPVAVNELGVKRWEPGAAKYLRDALAAVENLGANHAVWLWESDFGGIQYDDFNFRRGSSYKNHSESGISPLLEVLRKNWSQNRLRPSVKRW